MATPTSFLETPTSTGKKTIQPVTAPSTMPSGFRSLGFDEGFGALDKYFGNQLKNLGWKGSVFDNSSLYGGPAGDNGSGPELGANQNFVDWANSQGLSALLNQGNGENTLRLMQGNNLLGEQKYKTSNTLDKIADVGVPLAISLGLGGAGMELFGAAGAGGAAASSGGSGAAAGLGAAGNGSANAALMEALAGSAGYGGSGASLAAGVIPGSAGLAAGLGTAGSAGAAAGAPGMSGFDSILNALKTGGTNLLDKAAADPLKTLGIVGGLVGLNSAKPGSPPSFDAAAAAQAQGDANKDASWFDAILNRPDQYTPYGSSTWTLREGADPKNPQPGDWVNNVALDPAQQKLLEGQNQLSQGYNDTALGMMGRVQEGYGQPMDLSGLPGMPDFGSINTENDRARIEEALLARLEPQFARDEESLRSRLVNTGFEGGSAGTEIEMDRFGRNKNDARLSAIIQAGTEARGQSSEQRANLQAQQQARQQAFQEASALRDRPLNELNAFRTGSQVQSPQFQSVTPTNTGASPQMDALLAQLGVQQNTYNQQSAGYNQLLQSLAGLGGAYFGNKP